MPDTLSLNQSDLVVGSVDASVPAFTTADFANARHRIAAAARDACREHGFFYVDLDARQRGTIDMALAAMREFFSLPDDDRRKLDVRQDDRASGWVPRYTEPAYQPGTVSSLEAFDCDALDIGRRSERDCWPTLPGFHAAISRCWADFRELANRVLEVMGRAAGVSPDFFVRNCGSQQLDTLRLLHYAATPVRDRRRHVGIAAHTDFECITLIYQGAPGLELRKPTGEWIDAPYAGGRIVVLLGDMLERWTNGYFQATGHRVRETAEQRFSIVMFVAANDNIEIRPLSKFVSERTPASYRPVTQENHIENEMRRSRANAGNV